MLHLRNAHARRGRLKLLPPALLAAVAALVALTLSAGAQTPGGESGLTETAQGRIIARVQDRTDDGVDDYRIEFGFFPEWALDEAESWPEAIASRSDWLPSSRFLTKSRIDALAAADNRNWLRSSSITVPAQSAQSPGADGAEITGSVIARYNPDSEGRLRVEFGFVPEWAFADRASTEEAVMLLGVDGLPSARYLRVAAIDARREVWLRSSVIEVPLRAPAVVIETVQPPVIDGISCAPSSPIVGESVTCTATLSGGAPDSWSWSGGVSGGGEAVYRTSFSEAGERSVSLTVSNAAGSDTESTALTVVLPLQAPVIDGIRCAPSRPATADEYVVCTADLSGGVPDSWVWSGGVSGGRAVDYSPSFSAEGDHAISLTVANPAGSATDSIVLSVGDLQAPVVNAVNCTPAAPAVDREIICTAELGGGAPASWAWSDEGGSGAGESYSTSFSEAGGHTVSLTVANDAGSDTDSITLTVFDEVQPLVVDSISCTPSRPFLDQSVTCMASLSGGGPDSYSWSGGASTSSEETYSTSFSSFGFNTVSLAATNAAGSATGEFYLYIISTAPPEGLELPVIDSVSCTPLSPWVGNNVTCTATLSGGDPDSYYWNDGPGVGALGGETYSTSFSSGGFQSVALTVHNRAGTDIMEIHLFVKGSQRIPEGLEPPVIDGISCTPSSPAALGSVECTAELSGGAPTDDMGYRWGTFRAGRAIGGVITGDLPSFTTIFAAAGDYTISLSVSNAAGSDTDSVTLTVAAPQPIKGLQPPVIDTINCAPSSPTVQDSVHCTAGLSGGAPATYDWGNYGRLEPHPEGSVYAVNFGKPGDQTVFLTVSNAAGSDSASITLTVTDPINNPGGLQPPAIDAINCSPSSLVVNEEVTCTAEFSGDEPDAYAWRGGDVRGIPAHGSEAAFTTRFSSHGWPAVWLVVSNAGGSDEASITLEVVPPLQPLDGLQPPVIDAINCTPELPSVDRTVECVPDLSGGTPDTYSWDEHGRHAAWWWDSLATAWSEPGEQTIFLTVANSAGSDTHSISITIGGRRAPVIDSIRCSPASPTVNGSVECTAELSGGAPSSWSWSGDGEASSSAVYYTSFSSSGSKTVSLTVTNSAGSDADSISLTVFDAVQVPVIDSVSCTPSSPSAPVINESVTCTASLSGGAPDSYAWSGGASAGSDATYLTSFGSAGAATVVLTATNSAGSDTDSVGLTVLSTLQSPVIDSISCTPSSPTEGEDVTCTAEVSGGAYRDSETGWAKGGVSKGASGLIYTTSFSSPGLKTVSFQVDTAGGFDYREIVLTVVAGVKAPVIDSVSCTPTDPPPPAYTSVTCTASLSGGAPTAYAWSGGSANESEKIYRTVFVEAGQATVTLTVSNSAGSDNASTTLTIGPVPTPPVIDSISCTPSSPTVGVDVTCKAELSGGDSRVPTTYSWSLRWWNTGDTFTGSGETYSFNFSEPGRALLSLDVGNSGGGYRHSIDLTVFAASTD